MYSRTRASVPVYQSTVLSFAEKKWSRNLQRRQRSSVTLTLPPTSIPTRTRAGARPMSTARVNISHLQEWVGRSHIDRDILSSRHACLLSATLPPSMSTKSIPPLTKGSRLPPLWHWIYFLHGEPSTALGRDGHPSRGGFLPPVPLSNRMWAGGRVDFLAPKSGIPLDEEVEKRSTIKAVEQKQGRSGELVFVTVLHELFHQGRLAISEIHDIVYKEPSSNRLGISAATPAPSPSPVQMPTSAYSRKLKPDSTMLFRYSALTFNGHRIHYDADYCREVEGYPNLVIHGPLNATLLAGFAEEIAGRPLKCFNYRGLQPSFLGNELELNAAKEGEDKLIVWVSLPDGAVSMKAEALF